jgi:hypothetical protein
MIRIAISVAAFDERCGPCVRHAKAGRELQRREPANSGSERGSRHSRPLRCSAWRRYQVRRDISSLSQGFLASMVLARSSIRGRPFLGDRLIDRPRFAL